MAISAAVEIAPSTMIDAPAMLTTAPVPVADTYTFYTEGGESQSLRLDGALVDGPVFLEVGTYQLDARFSLVDAVDLPLWVAASVEGILPVALIGDFFTHDASDETPAIHEEPPARMRTAPTPEWRRADAPKSIPIRIRYPLTNIQGTAD